MNTCVEKASLFEKFRTTMSAYCDVMGNLRDTADTSDEAELRRLINRLGLEAARAREELMDHHAVHGC